MTMATARIMTNERFIENVLLRLQDFQLKAAISGRARVSLDMNPSYDFPSVDIVITKIREDGEGMERDGEKFRTVMLEVSPLCFEGEETLFQKMDKVAFTLEDFGALKREAITAELLRKSGWDLKEVGDHGPATPKEYRDRYERWVHVNNWEKSDRLNCSLFLDRTTGEWRQDDHSVKYMDQLYR